MKNIILSLTLVAALAGTVSAHCGSCGVGATKQQEKTATSRLETLTEELKLNAEQVKKVAAILEKQQLDVAAAKQKASGDIEALLSKKQGKRFNKMERKNKEGSACSL